jgi:hypothetical protein
MLLVKYIERKVRLVCVVVAVSPTNMEICGCGNMETAIFAKFKLNHTLIEYTDSIIIYLSLV